MIEQMTPNKDKVNVTQQGSKAIKPLRLPVFYGFIALAVLGIIIEQIVFPDLKTNPLILFILSGTTIFSILSIGASVSGLRPRLPRAAKIGLSVLVWGFALLDVIFLILPSVLPGPTSNDAAVQFSSAAPAASATQPAAATTKVVSSLNLNGAFNNQGDHAVAGNVTLGKTQDGQTVLRFENFNSANGPDLHVYLSKSASPATTAQVKNGIEVGKLKATQGSLNYTLDNAANLGEYKSVVIYCQSVSAIFGYANLK